jgi:hypothetical protein
MHKPSRGVFSGCAHLKTPRKLLKQGTAAIESNPQKTNIIKAAMEGFGARELHDEFVEREDVSASARLGPRLLFCYRLALIAAFFFGVAVSKGAWMNRRLVRIAYFPVQNRCTRPSP